MVTRSVAPPRLPPQRSIVRIGWPPLPCGVGCGVFFPLWGGCGIQGFTGFSLSFGVLGLWLKGTYKAAWVLLVRDPFPQHLPTMQGSSNGLDPSASPPPLRGAGNSRCLTIYIYMFSLYVLIYL